MELVFHYNKIDYFYFLILLTAGKLCSGSSLSIQLIMTRIWIFYSSIYIIDIPNLYILDKKIARLKIL